MAEVRISSQSERPCADIEETRTAAGDAGGGEQSRPRSSKRPRRKAACGTPKVQRSKNCTSRLSERAGAGGKPHLSRLYTRRTGEPFTGGSGWRQMTRSGATRAPCKGSDSPLCKERMKLTVETNLEGIAAKCCKPPVEERGAGHRRCSEAKTARHVLWEPGVGNCPR